MSIFLEKPLSCLALIFSAFLIISSGFKYHRKAKEKFNIE
jgi:hypothetical protein